MRFLDGINSGWAALMRHTDPTMIPSAERNSKKSRRVISSFTLTVCFVWGWSDVGAQQGSTPKFCHRLAIVSTQNSDKRNNTPQIYKGQMSELKEATNGAEKGDGIPLKRVEGLVLVMDTPKGAV